MGHYEDLYADTEANRERFKRLESAKTLANDVHKIETELRAVQQRLIEAGHHQLAWERLRDIVADLKASETFTSERTSGETKRQIAIAITNIETAMLWLRAGGC